jgi:hypothetical protein
MGKFRKKDIVMAGHKREARLRDVPAIHVFPR